MLIETMPGASDVAPTPNAAGKSSGSRSKGHGSFEALLNAASDEPTTSTPADKDDEVQGDEQMTVPVIVPFVPVVPPQEANACDESGDSHVELTGEVESSIESAVALAENVIAAAVTPQPGQGSAPQVGAPAEPPSSSIAVGEPEAPVPGPQAQRSNRPRVIDVVGIFPTVEDGNTGVVPPVSDEPVAEMPDGKPTKSAPQVSTPKMPAATDVQASGFVPEGGTAPQQDVPTQDGVAVVEPSTKGIAIDEPPPGSKGAAVRFARALGRVADLPIMQGAAAATAAENNPSFTQSGDEQSSFGEWFREQIPQAVAAGSTPASAPTFSVLAPASHVDIRVGETLAVANAGAVASPPFAPGEHDVTSQILQSLRMQFRDGIGEAVLKLKPEHLGTVSISLKVENGGLKAHVQAEMPAVRQWLESQQDTLRSALADHGLRLDRFEVEPDGHQQTQSDDDPRQRPSPKRQTRRLPPADQPMFEVVV